MASVKRKLVARSGLLTVLNLHKVCPDDGGAYESLDPYLFEKLVIYCVSKYEVVVFDQLHDLPAGDKPRLILSFDDGYKDFVDYACPVLARHKVQANMNIIPGCVESGLPPLNVLAADFIGQAPESLLCELAIPGLAPDALKGERGAVARRVSSFIKNRPIVEQASLSDLLWAQFSRFGTFRPTRLMTKADIAQISGTHELGAHSFDHATLAYETDAYAAADAQRCAAWFSAELGVQTPIYAFPNGSYRESQLAGIKAAGFTQLLATGEDSSAPEASVLNRFTFHARHFSEARFRTGGALRTPRKRLRVPSGSSKSVAVKGTPSVGILI